MTNRSIPRRRNPTAVILNAGLAVGVGLTALESLPVAAQQELVLEEITVTATRREQSLQDVGISVTALDGEQLANTLVNSTVDIAAQVPGLTFNTFSPSITAFNIRGVSQNDFGDQLEPPVAVYIDDSYVTTMGGVGVAAFDLDRAEVLRGPQGTQFGRNATGGLIHYISRRPTEELDGTVSIIAGSEGLLRTEAALGGPISDNAQFRLAGAYNERDGYIDNDIGPDLWAQDNYAIRGQLAFQPSDTIDLLLLGRFAENDEVGIGYTNFAAVPDSDGQGVLVGPNENPYGTCNACDLNGYRANPDPYKVSNNDVGRFEREITQLQGRIEWQIGDITLLSITDFQEMDKSAGEDTDGSPARLLVQQYRQELEQWSQELRLSGNTDKLRWTTGIYYLDWESDQGTTLRSEAAALGVSPEFPFITGYDSTYSTESWSVFLETEIDLTDSLSLILGGRYAEDEKTADYEGTDNFGSLLVFNPSVDPGAKQEWDDFAARVALNYQISEDTLLYASYNRGIKGPNFSAPSFFPFDPSEIPHDAEVLNAYEVGFKSTLADSRVRLNGGLFYYDYEDYQAYLFENVSNKIVNRDAEAWGGEVELTALIAEGFYVSAGLSFQDSEVENVPYPSGVGSFTSQLPQAPDYSFNFLARYERPLGDNFVGSLQLDYSYIDDFSFTVLAPPVDQEQAYGVANARVSFGDAAGKYELALFANNFTDEEYKIAAFDVSSIGYVDWVYAQRRWYGVQLRYNFVR